LAYLYKGISKYKYICHFPYISQTVKDNLFQ
jgi:hypothetical protein